MEVSQGLPVLDQERWLGRHTCQCGEESCSGLGWTHFLMPCWQETDTWTQLDASCRKKSQELLKSHKVGVSYYRRKWEQILSEDCDTEQAAILEKKKKREISVGSDHCSAMCSLNTPILLGEMHQTPEHCPWLGQYRIRRVESPQQRGQERNVWPPRPCRPLQGSQEPPST